MNKSESIANLAEALSKAQGAIKNAVKDSANPYFKSKYADLASVWDACRKELSDNGLSVVQVPEIADVAGDGFKIKVNTLLMHSSGEWISGDLVMIPVKEDPQGVGSAITYARRYALSAFVGIAPEDDDGNAASGKGTTQAKLNVPRTEEDIPIHTSTKNGNGNGKHELAPAEDRITVEQARKLYMRFRDSLPEQIKPKSEAILHDWLGSKMYLDESGKPSALAIRKDEFAIVGKSAVDFAKELAA